MNIPVCIHAKNDLARSRRTMSSGRRRRAPGAAVLGHLVGAASYVCGDRAGMTGQVEGDLLAVAFGERVRAGPRRGRQERGPGCRP